MKINRRFNGLMFAASTLLAAACASGNEELAGNGQDSRVDKTQTVQQPVAFDAYILRSTTRSGITGDVTTDGLKTGTHKDVGFGVLACYQDNSFYDGRQIPNFMYNEHVTWETSPGRFDYSPVKYWPNEFGSSAVSDHIDRLSFFAYAPFVEVDLQSGKAADTNGGITALTLNNYSGEPMVSYKVSADLSKGVDLCWANPILDQVRPVNLTDKVMMNFHHATTKLNVQVDAFVDGNDNSRTLLDGNTKIFVRSITLGGMALEGRLNLNSTDNPLWEGLKSEMLDRKGITFYDGRLDDEEGTSANMNESPVWMNPDLIQTAKWEAETAPGVTNTAVNLFSNATDATTPAYVIPTGDKLSVIIEYDIETADSLVGKLSDGVTPGISIPCKIKKTDVIEKLEPGKQYRLQLHLGMNSVKMEAKVADWNVDGETPADPERQQFEMLASIEVWLDGGEITVEEKDN